MGVAVSIETLRTIGSGWICQLLTYRMNPAASLSIPRAAIPKVSVPLPPPAPLLLRTAHT